MDEKDEERLVVLADQVIEVMSALRRIQKLLSELENEADVLLRRSLKRNGN